MRTYTERKLQPVTITGGLNACLWKEIKSARDAALNAMIAARDRYEKCDALLKLMKEEGMDTHLPTLAEIQALYRGEDVDAVDQMDLLGDQK